MIKFNISADLFRAASHTVSNEETRYYLGGVHIEPHPQGGALLVSTDGHRMTVLWDASGSISGGTIIIRPSKELMTAAKNKRGENRRIVMAEADTVSVELDGAKIASFHGLAIDGTFPDWSKVVPTGPFVPTKAGFNARYLGSFDKVRAELPENDRNGNGITILGSSEWDPHLVRFDGLDYAFGLIMPLRFGRGHVADRLPDFMAALGERFKDAA